MRNSLILLTAAVFSIYAQAAQLPSGGDCEVSLLAPEVQQALGLFSNFEITTVFNLSADGREEPVDSNDEFGGRAREYRAKFEGLKKFASAMDENFLPMKFETYSDTSIQYSRILDWAKLVGQAVVGYNESRGYSTRLTDQPDRRFTVTRNYFAGLVEKTAT
jgi:hypothetical protein